MWQQNERGRSHGSVADRRRERGDEVPTFEPQPVESSPGTFPDDRLLRREIARITHASGAQARPGAPPVVDHIQSSARTLAVQLKARKGGRRGGSPDPQEASAALAGGGGPLPHLDRIQQAFGPHDLSGIRAFTGPQGQAASQALGAEAFAVGDKVALGTTDLRVVAHEAAHVVQQRQGDAPAGGVGRDGDRWERQADAVAEKVSRGESAASLLGPGAEAGAGAVAVQRFKAKRQGEDAFTETGALTYIEAVDFEVRATYPRVGGITLRPSTPAELDASVNTAKQSVTTAKQALHPEQEVVTAATLYALVLGKALHIKDLMDLYDNLGGAQGGILARFNRVGVVVDTIKTHVASALEALDGPRESLKYDIVDGIEDTLTPHKTTLNSDLAKLYTVDGDHAVAAYMKSADARGAAASIFDTGDDAKWDVLVRLAGGVQVPNGDWKAAILSVAEGGTAHGDMKPASNFVAPNNVGDLANKQHRTIHKMGYSGLSVWGSFNAGVLTVVALAQHGRSNKHYNRESGTGTVPGSWQIS